MKNIAAVKKNSHDDFTFAIDGGWTNVITIEPGWLVTVFSDTGRLEKTIPVNSLEEIKNEFPNFCYSDAVQN